MSHEAAGMARVQDPAKGLGEVVGRIGDAGNVAHFNLALFAPVLDRKKLNINVSGAFGGALGIDHANGRGVVFIDDSRLGLGKTEVAEEHA